MRSLDVVSLSTEERSSRRREPTKAIGEEATILKGFQAAGCLGMAVRKLLQRL
jgi:hypothetical protein